MATGTSYTIQSCTRKFLQYILLARHIFSLSLANTCCMTDKQSVTRTYIHVVHLHDYMIVKFDVHVQYIYRLNCCQTTYSILTTLSAQTKLLHTRWMHVIFFTFNHKQNVNFSNTNLRGITISHGNSLKLLSHTKVNVFIQKIPTLLSFIRLSSRAITKVYHANLLNECTPKFM